MKMFGQNQFKALAVVIAEPCVFFQAKSKARQQ
jgi:hypothetical protein